MAHVIPCSISNVSLAPETAFITRRNNCLTRCKFLAKSTKQTLSSQRFLLPLSTSVRLFPQYRSGSELYRKSRIHILSATGTDVAVEEPDTPVADETAGGASEISPNVVETSEESSIKSTASPTSAQSKRSRPIRKSEMPPVKNEELVPGATFTGKVRSIQPFGAFVDFGAFTDGLVHVSRLSDSFVKDVGSIVSVGQEVKVRLVEANTETGRISLTMRESDDISKLQQQKDAPAGSDKGRPARRNTSKSNQSYEGKRSSKFVKGQDLEGTVKNLTRSGAFISLPEGEEGFLPRSEEVEEGFANIMGGTSLQVGQEVSIRVLRITRGQVTLTMKKEEDVVELDSQLSQGGVVYAATNPFVLAFRKNKDIATFLDEREKVVAAKIPEVQDQPLGSSIIGDALTEVANSVKDPESMISILSESVDGAAQTIEEEAEASSEILAPEGSVSTADQITEEAPTKDGVEVAKSEESADQILSSESLSSKEVIENLADDTIAKDEVQIQTPTAENEIPSATSVEDVASIPEKNGSITSSSGESEKSTAEESVDGAVQTIEEVEASSEILAPEESVSTADQITEEAPTKDGVGDVKSEESAGRILSSESPSSEEVIESLADDTIAKDEVQIQTPTAENEIPSASPVEDVVSIPEKNVSITSSSGESEGSTAEESVDGAVQTIEEEAEASSEILAPEGSVSTADQITEEAPTKDEVEDDVKSNSIGESADQILSSEGLSSKEVIENLADDAIAKDEVQIQTPNAENKIPASTPIEDVVSIPEKNGSISSSSGQSEESMAEDEVESDGKAELSGEIADDQTSSRGSQASEDVVENQVDSSMAKDEVQIQTPAAESEISSATPVEDENAGPVPEKSGSVSNSNGQTSVPSSKESVTKAAISPALVKQLREETGAGMMDCKKALSETGGDIVKAQEFLRKKGLASADKKASRATAEGRIGSYIHDGRIGILIEVNCETDFVSRGDIFKELVDDLAMQAAACPQVQYLATEDVPKEIVSKEREIEMQKEDLLSKPEQIRSKIVEGRIRKRLEELALLEQPYIKNDKVIVKDWVKQTIATIGENMKVKRFVRYNLGEGLEKKNQDFAAEVAAQTAAKAVPAPVTEQPAAVEAKETVEKPPTVTVSAALVKQLREETGAGMMDCKKALSETGGDLEKAQEYLRKKGLSSADKKSSRIAAEGRIGSYIHDSRIGVLIEVNCETDFVGRSEKFKELVDDLAMQVVACPQVQFVSIEDIPESIVSKEKELEMQREDLLSKPVNIRERIVEGRISKRLGELALLEQPFIKNDSLLVKDLVKQTVAALGENIKVRRFVRFTLGEEIENAKMESEA